MNWNEKRGQRAFESQVLQAIDGYQNFFDKTHLVRGQTILSSNEVSIVSNNQLHVSVVQSSTNKQSKPSNVKNRRNNSHSESSDSNDQMLKDQNTSTQNDSQQSEQTVSKQLQSVETNEQLFELSLPSQNLARLIVIMIRHTLLISFYMICQAVRSTLIDNVFEPDARQTTIFEIFINLSIFMLYPVGDSVFRLFCICATSKIFNRWYDQYVEEKKETIRAIALRNADNTKTSYVAKRQMDKHKNSHETCINKKIMHEKSGEQSGQRSGQQRSGQQRSVPQQKHGFSSTNSIGSMNIDL